MLTLQTLNLFTLLFVIYNFKLSVQALFLGGEIIPFDDFVPENFDDLNHGVYSEMVSPILGGVDTGLMYLWSI